MLLTAFCEAWTFVFTSRNCHNAIGNPMMLAILPIIPMLVGLLIQFHIFVIHIPITDYFFRYEYLGKSP